MKQNILPRLLTVAAISAHALPSYALEWSDNAISFRTGNTYAEPGIPGESIRKNVYSFNHASGDRLGRNLVVADVLISDSSDPEVGGGGGAQEFYGFYRRTFSLSRLTDKPMRFGPVKDINLVGRIDLQTKNIQFAPRARKLSSGVSFDFNMPIGFFETGIYAYSETNHNGILGKDVSFKTTAMLDASWMLPFHSALSGAWKGNLSYIGTKGKDGFGADTKPETRLFTALMFDVGEKTGFAVGMGAEIWRNKYGNDQSATPGAKHNTALLLAEYHF